MLYNFKSYISTTNQYGPGTCTQVDTYNFIYGITKTGYNIPDQAEELTQDFFNLVDIAREHGYKRPEVFFFERKKTYNEWNEKGKYANAKTFKETLKKIEEGGTKWNAARVIWNDHFSEFYNELHELCFYRG